MRTHTSNAIGNRYMIEYEIGKGGMGVVYNAHDRLTGNKVALKRVSLSSSQLDFASKASAGDSANLRVALAREFRTLASLRHPNIISVLDYGFDENSQPYYVMEFLEDVNTIIEAGQGQAVDVQVDLLVQTLQALAYLHRRGIIHRDLKPDNVLVSNGRIRVLDFGLAVARDHLREDEDSFVGTFAYAAPEIIEGQPASMASDLYAIGIIACELLTGQHPFGLSQPVGSLIASILTSPPNIDTEQIDERLEELLFDLLARQPSNRLPNATTAIRRVAEAGDRLIPEETTTIRESYLQAADFVGREEELEQLAISLKHTINGHGSVWLIGGESGVGKSRLMDELRIHALVEGALVLHGQAMAEGGAPYALWRDVLRALCLQPGLTDLQASVLKPLVPDIADLIERDVPDALQIDPAAARDRLLLVIEEVFSRQSKPLVVLLEDLQWADESLAIMVRLSRLVQDIPVMMVGNYRVEESPDLPTKSGLELDARHIHQMTLSRLSEGAIADLSASMLGEEIGRQEHIVDLLQRETEGNVFFIVEVVRALAEEAGQLAQVGGMTLPRKVYAEGIKTVVQRRLEHIPEDAFTLLQIAAIAGRALDPVVLGATLGGEPGLQSLVVNTWLATCANAMVLEIGEGGQWRFAHDKLREGVLDQVYGDKAKHLHQQVAMAIEHVYGEDPQQIAKLVHHWRNAGDIKKTAHYSGRAGEQMLMNGAYTEATNLLEHAIELADQSGIPSARQAILRRKLGETYYALGEFDKSKEHNYQALRLLKYPMPVSNVILILGLAGQIVRQIVYRLIPFKLPTQRRQDEGEMREVYLNYENLGGMFMAEASTIQVFYILFRILNLAEYAEPSPELARNYASCAIVFGLFPFLYKIADYFGNLAMETIRQKDDPAALARVSEIIAMYYIHNGRWQESEEAFIRGGQVAHSIRQLRIEGECWGTLGVAYILHGEFIRAREHVQRQVDLAVQRGDIQHQLYGLSGLAECDARLEPQGYNLQNFSLLAELDEAFVENPPAPDLIRYYGALAEAYLHQDERVMALNSAEKALALIQAEFRPTVIYAASGYLSVTAVLLALSEQSPHDERLQKMTQQAVQSLKGFSQVFPVGKPRAYLYEGVTARREGRQDKAWHYWQKSLAYAQELDMPYEQGLAHYEIGRHLPEDDSQRHKHLQAAEVCFEQVQAQWDLTQVRETLR